MKYFRFCSGHGNTGLWLVGFNREVRIFDFEVEYLELSLYKGWLVREHNYFDDLVEHYVCRQIGTLPINNDLVKNIIRDYVGCWYCRD